MLVPLASSSKPVPIANFWSAVFVYYDRPHLVNRKLNGCSTLFNYKLSYNSSNSLREVLNHTSLTYETNKLKEFTKNSLTTLVDDLLRPYDKQLCIEEVAIDDVKSSHGVFLSVRILFASNSKSLPTVELVILDKTINKVTFLAGSTKDKYLLVAPPFAYDFQLTTSGMFQLVVHFEDADTSSGEWLADKLFPKMLKWIEECNENITHIQSLNLIPMEKYCTLYQTLKEKYGKKMVEIWPENTDPLKFVYEDVAIATYLICLWSERNDKVNFIDLGCGNGLLVYILNSEGYEGIGIDVRSRKIWDLYPSSVKLIAKTIVPSDSSLFPDATWIIGNHSDELTPWIPVISARSSMTTNFFLLPCCCYNFDATKYIRKNPALSQYAEYLHYIETICNSCGFITKVDKLRIPSTKRTCLISFGRKYQDMNQTNEAVTSLLTASYKSTTDNAWIEDYNAREAKEKVRNCTQLNRDFLTKIVKKLVNYLITCEETVMIKKYDNSLWNSGAHVDILTLVKQLHPEELKQLKKECGGLQTLMKNHRYIFDVAKGKVKLRIPYLRRNTIKYVDKPCWFLVNHPNGCLYSDSECAYSHSNLSPLSR